MLIRDFKQKRGDVYQKRCYRINLCETEIGILKASLKYFRMCELFGYDCWSVGGGSADTKGYWFLFVTGDLYEVLDNLSGVKPNFGYWGNVKYIGSLLNKDIKEYQKKAKKIEAEFGRSIFDLELDALNKKTQEKTKHEHRAQSKVSRVNDMTRDKMIDELTLLFGWKGFDNYSDSELKDKLENFLSKKRQEENE